MNRINCMISTDCMFRLGGVCNRGEIILARDTYGHVYCSELVDTSVLTYLKYSETPLDEFMRARLSLIQTCKLAHKDDQDLVAELLQRG